MQNIRINRKQPNTFYQKSMFSKAIIQKVVLDRGNHLSGDIARKTLDVRFQGLVGRNVSHPKHDRLRPGRYRRAQSFVRQQEK